MIDLHSHLLPGLDDGPDRAADAVAMARAACEDGVRTMVATPHMSAAHPTDPARVHEAAAELAALLGREGVDLRVLPGGEIALPHLPRMGPEALARATLGGAGRWVLLEMPLTGPPFRLADALRALEFQGLGAVLAHPERADWVQRSPERMHEPIGRGALVQVTAASFLGEHGPRARATAVALLRGGMAHLMASDAHSPDRRPPGLAAGLAAAAGLVDVDPAALAWMADEGPAQVLDGRPVRPPRLVTPRRRTPPGDARAGPRGRPRPMRR